jgi:hypothetical protein
MAGENIREIVDSITNHSLLQKDGLNRADFMLTLENTRYLCGVAVKFILSASCRFGPATGNGECSAHLPSS